MNARTLLNYQFQQISAQHPTLVFLHGLFGDSNNLGIIAKGFSQDYNILRLDLRNHGQSFQTDEMNYALMADDIYQLLQQLQLTQVSLIGHSMGGKTAMTFSAQYPTMVEKLIVIDIAPVPYPPHHQAVFAGLFALQQANISTRQQARPLLEQYIKQESIVQFMLKSFSPEKAQKFRFNLTALFNNYDQLMAWTDCYYPKPTLFIRGDLSDYIQPQDRARILRQFPKAQAFTISGADHWVHAEKPEAVMRAIKRFLDN